jgi:hypothetical protein
MEGRDRVEIALLCGCWRVLDTRMGQRKKAPGFTKTARKDSFLTHAVPWCTPYHPHPNSIMPCSLPVRVSLQFGIGSRMYNPSRRPVRIRLRMQIKAVQYCMRRVDELASRETWGVSSPRLPESLRIVQAALSSMSPVVAPGSLGAYGAILRIAVHPGRPTCPYPWSSSRRNAGA